MCCLDPSEYIDHDPHLCLPIRTLQREGSCIILAGSASLRRQHVAAFSRGQEPVDFCFLGLASLVTKPLHVMPMQTNMSSGGSEASTCLSCVQAHWPKETLRSFLTGQVPEKQQSSAAQLLLSGDAHAERWLTCCIDRVACLGVREGPPVCAEPPRVAVHPHID